MMVLVLIVLAVGAAGVQEKRECRQVGGEWAGLSKGCSEDTGPPSSGLKGWRHDNG